MSDILKQIDTYKLIEYWKHEAYKSELKVKSVINERDELIERFLEEKTNHETRIKELEAVVLAMDNCMQTIFSNVKICHRMHLELLGKTKHKDLINDILEVKSERLHD